MNHIYEVIHTAHASPSTLVLTMRSTDPDRPLAYQPGQYATLSFHRGGRPTPVRCFSIASSPTEQHLLQFCIRINGHFTRAAEKATKVGDKITIGGPYGGFILNTVRDQNSVFLAGGIGIAPFMSMIRYATRLGLPNDITLLYACRSQDDVPFADELAYMAQINPHFHPIFVIGSGSIDKFAGKQAVVGRLNGDLLTQVIGGNYSDKSFFLCGPAGFMASLHKVLAENNVPDNRILSEAFNQDGRNQGKILGLSAKIYAFTAASMIIGPAIGLAHDILNPPYINFGMTKKTEDKKAQANTRDEDIEAQLRGLGGQDIVVGSIFAGDIPNFDPDVQPEEEAVTTEQVEPVAGQATQPTGTAPKTTTTTPKSTTTSKTTTTTSTTPKTTTSTTTPKTTTTTTPATTTTAKPPTTSAPTPTPTPTVTVIKPALTLSANQTSITAGNSVTLSWSTTGTAPISCTAAGGWSGTKAGSGSQSVSPTATTTYTLTCANSAGSSQKSVTVTVSPAPVAPSVTFSASSTTITEGDSVSLVWNSTGTSPISCSASGGWSGTKAGSGSQSVSPGSTTTYNITCTNSAGTSATKSVRITVNPASTSS